MKKYRHINECKALPLIYIEHYILLCSLLECADKVANTDSVYGAYLKQLKTSAK